MTTWRLSGIVVVAATLAGLLAQCGDESAPCTGVSCSNHGRCFAYSGERYCECDVGHLSRNDDGSVSETPCDYKQISSLAAILISVFLGGCGIDFCFLSRGDGCYICLGVLKGVTLGALGVWWLTDIIRIGVQSFPDGNGVPLKDF